MMKYILFFLIYLLAFPIFALENIFPFDAIPIANSFLSALSNCQTSNYNYDYKGDTYAASILGWQNNVCIVDISKKHDNVISQKHCEFPSESLTPLSSQSTTLMSRMNQTNLEDLLKQPQMYIEMKDNAEMLLNKFDQFCKPL